MGTGTVVYKVIPKTERPGAMIAVAGKLGYEGPTDILVKDIPEYVDLLVDTYGEKSARGMLQAQIVFRKNAWGAKAKNRDKFQRMMDYLNKEYAG